MSAAIAAHDMFFIRTGSFGKTVARLERSEKRVPPASQLLLGELAECVGHGAR